MTDIDNNLELAERYFEASEIVRAELYFDKVLATSPHNARAWFGIGKCALAQLSPDNMYLDKPLNCFKMAIDFSVDKEAIKREIADSLVQLTRQIASLGKARYLHNRQMDDSEDVYIGLLDLLQSIIDLAVSYDGKHEQALILGIELYDLRIEVVLKNFYSWEPRRKQLMVECEGHKSKYKERLKSINPDHHLSAHQPQTQSTNQGCFIVTASMGDDRHKNVIIMKEYRDQVLVNSFLGKSLIRMYYIYGIYPAKIIERNVMLRRLSKNMLLPPIVWLVEKSLRKGIIHSNNNTRK